MREPAIASLDPSPTISVRCDRPGVVLEVRGSLDAAACELLGEVVRAALVAVKRATRIHLDLSYVTPAPEQLPRVVQRLEQAGARVTAPALARHATLAPAAQSAGAPS